MRQLLPFVDGGCLQRLSGAWQSTIQLETRRRPQLFVYFVRRSHSILLIYYRLVKTHGEPDVHRWLYCYGTEKLTARSCAFVAAVFPLAWFSCDPVVHTEQVNQREAASDWCCFSFIVGLNYNLVPISAHSGSFGYGVSSAHWSFTRTKTTVIKCV